ncbi:hypothetical protein [Tsukamurella sp. 1534]|uniref:hypothetical protein n=1 Tax=Tsukamurella sp. 1534 TaxID=1151061 RepID=UPI0002E0A3CB|nr:hypothetical protein [Tsukamurella sp. 1534]
MSNARRLTTPVTTVAVAALGGLLLAGCGGGSESSSGAESGAATSTATAAESSAAQEVTRGQMCGQTRGPDGALYVHVVGSAKVDCGEAMKVANAFGPMIASAKPATVEGWNCHFTDTPGMLARCDSAPKSIGFFSSH